MGNFDISAQIKKSSWFETGYRFGPKSGSVPWPRLSHCWLDGKIVKPPNSRQNINEWTTGFAENGLTCRLVKHFSSNLRSVHNMAVWLCVLNINVGISRENARHYKSSIQGDKQGFFQFFLVWVLRGFKIAGKVLESVRELIFSSLVERG